MGPLELTDMIGQDVNFAVTCSVFNAFWQERRFLPSLVQQELVLAGRLGKKAGRAFTAGWRTNPPSDGSPRSATASTPCAYSEEVTVSRKLTICC